MENVAAQNTHPWYVQVSGQVYGPYQAGQMLAYIREGRIVPESLVSQNPSGSFFNAGQSALFKPMRTFHNPSPQLQAPEVPAPQVSHSSVFLVMAEISSDNAMRFLHLIQRLGTAQRIGDSVWLLRAHMEIETLRDQLSASLSRQDRLFIMDSFNNKTAWHNIGADMDDRIRALWENRKL